MPAQAGIRGPCSMNGGDVSLLLLPMYPTEIQRRQASLQGHLSLTDSFMTNPAKTSLRRLGKAQRAQHLTLGGRDVGHAALCPTYKLLRMPPSLAPVFQFGGFNGFHGLGR
jgi:hypothetical protein